MPFSSGVYNKSKQMPDFSAGFDSASAMVMSVSQFLDGSGFPGTGALPSSETLGKIVDMFPASWKQKFYAESGKFDGLDAEKIAQVDLNEMEQWVTDCYPKRKYPAIAIGSSNGALVHLYAALGIPWLPQTFMIPVKKPEHLDKDKPKTVMEWAKKPADSLLFNNPEFRLHHMMDPNHDRLHLNTITYFRVKKLGLGDAYSRFIRDNLAEGGTIIMINCQQQWPIHRLSDKHVFQFGGAGGGLTPDEYYRGNARISHFLNEQGAAVDRWDAPTASTAGPEAEWGYDPQLSDALKDFCRKESYQLHEIRFEKPEDASPPVADFYRHWYRKRDIPDDQLLIECFALHDPYWAIKTGSVPFWLVFNDQPSADFAARYLQRQDFNKIYMMLMSHGTKSIGLADIGQWDSLLGRAKQKHAYLGVDREHYPLNFGVYMSYFEDLKDKIKDRYPLPESVSLQEVKQFIQERDEESSLQWHTIAL
jgi:hypothetical protein